jgi:hypothetical protein
VANPDYAAGAFMKPPKGSYKLERDAAKVKVKSSETAEKTKVRLRDGAAYCRLVPRCTFDKHATAHIFAKGMGGDHGTRTKAELMVRSCWHHHQGPWSLHSYDLRVEFLTDAKADGPIAIWGRDEHGREYLVGKETAVCQWERD